MQFQDEQQPASASLPPYLSYYGENGGSSTLGEASKKSSSDSSSDVSVITESEMDSASSGSSEDPADVAAGTSKIKKNYEQSPYTNRSKQKKHRKKKGSDSYYVQAPPISGASDLFFSNRNYHKAFAESGSEDNGSTRDGTSIDIACPPDVIQPNEEIIPFVTEKESKSTTRSRRGDTPTKLTDLEIKKDGVILLAIEPVIVLGMDISHLSRQTQFIVCSLGVFGFSLLYGFLQELISVQVCNRQLGLFLATVQFSGYTLLSYLLRTLVYKTSHNTKKKRHNGDTNEVVVPWTYYAGVSLLRAIDLGMTNLAMQYINYPAKTLMKSSRIVFTMLFGVVIGNKKYRWIDYFIVVCMVLGLVVFMHADANSSAVFHPMGVIMLTMSLICDGAVSNYSEHIMSHYNVGQDEFIFKMYSISLIAITAAALYKGDLSKGLYWMSQPGTYDELYGENPNNTPSWSVGGKIIVMILFSSMGFIGSSFSAAITKNFGALAMSITSTARKATTVFLSFFFFDNECTLEHIAGVFIFIGALVTKSLRTRQHSKGGAKAKHSPAVHHHRHAHKTHHKHKRSKQKPKSTFRNLMSPITTAERIKSAISSVWSRYSHEKRNRKILEKKLTPIEYPSDRHRSFSSSPVRMMDLEVAAPLGNAVRRTYSEDQSDGLHRLNGHTSKKYMYATSTETHIV